jgi:hypothetical protein
MNYFFFRHLSVYLFTYAIKYLFTDLFITYTFSDSLYIIVRLCTSGEKRGQRKRHFPHSPKVSLQNGSYLLTYLLTYLLIEWLTDLLTPRSRVLLEKLTGFQLVKKFPAFYGTRRFITAFTSARHLSLSSPSSIPTSHTLKIHLNIILPST